MEKNPQNRDGWTIVYMCTVQRTRTSLKKSTFSIVNMRFNSFDVNVLKNPQNRDGWTIVYVCTAKKSTFSIVKNAL